LKQTERLFTDNVSEGLDLAVVEFVLIPQLFWIDIALNRNRRGVAGTAKDFDQIRHARVTIKNLL
jgi:hypothetical protein